MPGIVTAVQDWASTISSRYHPICKQSACRPLAPSVTCGDSSLPEGAMGCVPFHMGLCLWEVPTVNPSGKNQRFLPAPFSKGAFGCGIDTGRVREVAIRRKPPCAMTAAARRPFGKGAFGCAADTGWGREVTNCRKPPAFAGGLFLWKL